MAMSKKPKYERSDDYRYQYIRAHPGFMGKYYLCPYCGRIMLKKTMQVDHIVSISLANKHRAYRVLVPDGNINNLHNLTASCPKCNNRKSDSGGFWIFLARFGVVFYAVIWLLLLGFAAWFAIGAATGHIQRGFLLPYFSAAGNVLMQGTANVILGVSFAVMVAAVGVMGMTMVQNKNADKSSIPAVGGSFSVTGNVAEDTSFTEQAAVAPSTALTSDGRRWAMGASNVLIQAEDGTGAVVPVDAAETFQYDGKSLSFEKDGATYIVRMVADSYTGAAQYAEEQTDESLTVSGMRFAGNGQVLVVVGTRSAGDEEGNAAVRTAVADMLEKAVPAQGSGNITLNGVAVTVDGCEASFSNGLALIKSGDGEVKFTPSSYDSETIAFDDAGTTASGAAVTHSDYANVNDTEAYLIESDEGNVMAFTNNADLLTSVLGLQ